MRRSPGQGVPAPPGPANYAKITGTGRTCTPGSCEECEENQLRYGMGMRVACGSRGTRGFFRPRGLVNRLLSQVHRENIAGGRAAVGSAKENVTRHTESGELPYFLTCATTQDMIFGNGGRGSELASFLFQTRRTQHCSTGNKACLCRRLVASKLRTNI